MSEAYELAHDLRAALLPGCERLEVAGSIRRGKPDPKDIELVGIAKHAAAPIVDMFGEVVASHGENLLETEITNLRFRGEWDFDHVLKRAGPKYKRLRHIESGICCDLFITTPECWGVIFAIRTGPGDFSKEIVTRARRLSMVVDEGQLWRTHRDDTRTVVPTPDEAAFFTALRLPYLEPAERTVRALTAISMKARETR